MTPLLPLVLGPEAVLLEPTRALAPVLFALVERNRERLARWLPWVDHVRTVADEARFLEECRRAFDRGERLPGVLAVRGAVVGMVSLTVDCARASGEIGYWVDRDAEGRGHVSSAVARLCALGFEELQLDRIVIRAAVENVRSRSVAERAGFRLERLEPGALRLHGRAVDVAVYACSRTEWPGVEPSSAE